MRHLSRLGFASFLTIIATAGSAKAFGPHLFVRLHSHHQPAPTVPLQPITPGQVVAGFQLLQGAISGAQNLLQHSGATQTGQGVSKEVFSSLDKTDAALKALTTRTNSLLDMVQKSDSRVNRTDHPNIAPAPSPTAGTATTTDNVGTPTPPKK